MTDIENLALEIFENKISDIIKNNGHFECVDCKGKSADKGSFIVYVFDTSSVYRDSENKTENIAYISKSGKSIYIGFNEKYKRLFDDASISYPEIASDHRIHFDENTFAELGNNPLFPMIIEKIIFSTSNYSTFGCCSRYEKCSDMGRCIHDDIFYATASCEYKKHLDKGEIFYGKNKNI